MGYPSLNCLPSSKYGFGGPPLYSKSRGSRENEQKYRSSGERVGIGTGDLREVLCAVDVDQHLRRHTRDTDQLYKHRHST